MQKLNEAINMARIESRISKFFDKLSNTDLLIVDDFGLVKLSGQQLIDFMRSLKTGMQGSQPLLPASFPLPNGTTYLPITKPSLTPSSTE